MLPVIILEILNVLLFFPKGPIGPRGPSGPLGKSGEDVCIHLHYYKFFSKASFVFFELFASERLNVNVCFADSQGNNGRPGKPGDRGAPGPQVKDIPLKESKYKQIF